ncbi:MAG: hypothetical protein LBO78_01360 [Rickettsiales bacterium]|jgi:hypothetical protein|nr:hypothetical protein [Rickettsiales bacterium]
MTSRQKAITPEARKDMEDTLSLIDVSLYDLIEKRIEIIQKLDETAGFSASGLSGALAKTIQGITSLRKYDPRALSVASGLIELININAKNIEIAILKSDEGIAKTAGSIALLKSFYPLVSGIRYRIFEKHSDAVAAIAASKNLISFIPAEGSPAKDAWWMGMLAEEKQGAKIVGRQPMASSEPGMRESYMVAHAENAFGFDRSVIVIATSETVTSPWLKAALHKLKIPLYKTVASSAVFNGTVLTMAEISAAIYGMDAGIFKTSETVGGVNIRVAGYLGGYFLPIVDRDKIVEFRK